MPALAIAYFAKKSPASDVAPIAASTAWDSGPATPTAPSRIGTTSPTATVPR